MECNGHCVTHTRNHRPRATSRPRTQCGMFVMGFFAGVSIDRFGQKLVCIVGVALIGIGYLLLRGCVLNGWSESVVGFSLFVIGTGGISSLMAMLTWQQSQYSVANRGKITALLLAAYCLSGALWAPIYEANYAADVMLPDYCVLLAWVSAALGVVIIVLTGEWRIGSGPAVPAAVAAGPGDAAAVEALPAALQTTTGTPSAIPWEKRGQGDDAIGAPSPNFGEEDDDATSSNFSGGTSSSIGTRVSHHGASNSSGSTSATSSGAG